MLFDSTITFVLWSFGVLFIVLGPGCIYYGLTHYETDSITGGVIISVFGYVLMVLPIAPAVWALFEICLGVAWQIIT